MSPTTDATTPQPHTPVPGVKYTFHVCDIADAAVQRLGDGWSAKDRNFGVAAVISGPFIATFDLHVDDDEDLAIAYTAYKDDDFPERDEYELPAGVRSYSDGVYLVDAEAADGLIVLADRVAAAIRCVVTGHPLT